MSMTSFQIINLDQQKGLFRDEGAFLQFTKWLGESLKHDLQPIMCGERVIGSSLSPGATKEYLYERMIRRMAERPELLAELTDRMEHDDIVE